MGDNNNILICDKGDMMLSSYLIDNMKAYTLAFSLNEIDTSKINL